MKYLKYILPIFLALATVAAPAAGTVAGPPRGVVSAKYELTGADSILLLQITGVTVYARKADMRRHEKLVRNVKKVYPLAQEAQRKLAQIEADAKKIARPAARKEYLRKMEKEIIKEYTPVLKKMTFSQGKILIKLIDRQTDKTSYDILKELRGGFQAALWQGVAKLFDADLKQGYDKDGEDKLIEQIINLYEAGLI